MYSIYFPSLGCVLLSLRSLFIQGGLYHITGKDEDGNEILFNIDRASFPDDYFDDYGWMHVVAYTINNVVHKCANYVSFG